MTALSSIPVQPVILCGGSGTRLWPLSRAGFPKQFLCLTGNDSLFQLEQVGGVRVHALLAWPCGWPPRVPRHRVVWAGPLGPARAAAARTAPCGDWAR